ncbi:type I pullulanase [Oceanivirga miroungae]|uniref:Pullulanase n=1 Tax=Oceanivirga miroungae TaxID=1130046 RepID=A0A6I8MCI6_9FUSO|nr:type I pullulanase [Oceanivirga miroungae]VWL84829.1 Pullulanase [Oceanivirga miroungae]
MIIHVVKFNELEIKTDRKINKEDILITGFNILEFFVKDNIYTLILDKNLLINDLPEIKIFNENKELLLTKLFKTKEFDNLYYTEEKLGALYTNTHTIFKVWSPLAKEINLILVDDNTKYPMSRKENAVFEIKIDKDLLNQKYLYEVIFKDKKNISTDPYAISSSANEKYSVVVDIKENNTNFLNHENKIIYEASIRDLTFFKDSNIENKAKFLGLTEENKATSFGQKVGLDYIKDLGINYIQFLPIFDFSSDSVDELNQFSKYNWGYDPVNYNVVEGSYSANPHDPNSRILELQNLIKVLHNNSISVIMDVVYNHVFDAKKHSFDLIVPNYYFRLDENNKYIAATGCSNDVASEHSMVRRYIVDSLIFWLSKYKFDGFRFDLMGILDLDTMAEIYDKLSRINKNILILGEGWDMPSLEKEKRANQKNADKIPNIAFFNDSIRDLIKGSTFENIGCGYISRVENNEKNILKNILSGYEIMPYTKPSQLIQYVEAHDNLTLYDQLKLTMPYEDENDIIKRHLLGTSIILFSFGIPFIHSGQEFLRTKMGDENSYKSSDDINMIDYKRAYEFSEYVDYFKELVKIRKYFNIFTLNDFEKIKKCSKVLKDDNYIIAYEIKDLIIVHNANYFEFDFDINNGKYTVLVNNHKAKLSGLDTINIVDNKVKLNALSTLVLVKS